MEEIRNKLKEFVLYEDGERLRKLLNENAINNYKQKHNDADYIDFMERHEVTFRINHPQSQNHPYYYTMFSCKTQHIMGDSIREVMDKALDVDNRRD